MIKITRNSIICNRCGDSIESTADDDFVTCTCGNVAVYGGHTQLSRCYKNSRDDYTDTSIVEEVEDTGNETATA